MSPPDEDKDLLRFITCGSVDDGKSTLIGRLLFDSGQVSDDQRAMLAEESRRFGTQGDALDYALIVDGLSAEREQGITIDVAYRYFASPRRKFIVADAPGHEQYTRNMVTGASTADLALILVDAGKGVLAQTRRHSLIARLLGIRHFVVAVTKMDLVDYDEAAFQAVTADYRRFAEGAGIAQWTAIPVSGLSGDNVVTPSERMPWYKGPSLLGHLESVPLPGGDDLAKPLRMPVQWVNRPNREFRGYSGQIASGSVGKGSAVRILPSGRTTRIAAILAPDGESDEAVAGQSVTLTFDDAVDCSRGDVVALADDPPPVADQFEATLVWFDETELLPGRGYWLKLASQSATATVQPPKYEINVDSQEHLAADTLAMNGIGVVEIATDRPIVFEPYDGDGGSPNRALGGFILIDKMSNATVAAGMLHFALRRSTNIHPQALEVSRETHAELKGQKPAVLWFTGLSGSGKSAIANIVEKKLAALGRHSFLLDGDNVRHGLSRDLGFTDADRIENMRRVGEVAKLMADAGLIVLVAFIAPFRAERAMVRKMIPDGEFIEVFVDTPIEEAERRDSKGLYAKARAGEIKNFTGIDSPYEAPENPDIRIDTMAMSAEDAADLIVEKLLGRRG